MIATEIAGLDNIGFDETGGRSSKNEADYSCA
jgi:hypothetical protein